MMQSDKGTTCRMSSVRLQIQEWILFRHSIYVKDTFSRNGAQLLQYFCHITCTVISPEIVHTPFAIDIELRDCPSDEFSCYNKVYKRGSSL